MTQPTERDIRLVARALAPTSPNADQDLLYREDAVRVLKALAEQSPPPHQQHRDEFEDAHMSAAGAIMGARMAGKNIPPWSSDMNDAFRVAVAEAFDAGAQAERKATR